MGNPERSGRRGGRAGGQDVEYEIPDGDGNPTRWFATQDPRGYLLARHRAYPGYVFELIQAYPGYAFDWADRRTPGAEHMDPAISLRNWYLSRRRTSIYETKASTVEKLRGSPDAPHCVWDPAAQGPLSRDAEDLMFFSPHELAVAECRLAMDEFRDRPLILDEFAPVFLRRYEALTISASADYRRAQWCARMVPSLMAVTVIAQLREENLPPSAPRGTVCGPSSPGQWHQLAVIDPSAPGSEYWNHPDSRYSLTVPFPSSCPADIITGTTFRSRLRAAVLRAADAADEHHREVFLGRPSARRASGNSRQGSRESRGGAGPARP